MRILVRILMFIWTIGRGIKRTCLVLTGRARHTPPPRWDEVPADIQKRFTMNGQIAVVHQYMDDAYPESRPIHYSRFKVNFFMKRIRAGNFIYYGKTLDYMQAAFARHPLRGQDVVVMGSNTPACEAVTLLYGGRPFTIEYNKLTTNDDRLTLMTVKEFQEHPRQFDAAISISSFEHDGLGRYGDPLNPDGDLDTMQRMLMIVKPGGLLFLAVPVGRDCLIWNAGRCYGPIRFPLLTAGWNLLDVIGGLDYGRDWSDNHQPVAILRNDANQRMNE